MNTRHHKSLQKNKIYCATPQVNKEPYSLVLSTARHPHKILKSKHRKIGTVSSKVQLFGAMDRLLLVDILSYYLVNIKDNGV